MLIDLLLNWSALDEPTFAWCVCEATASTDAASRGFAGPLEGLQAFLTALLERSVAAPLPDAEPARAATLRRCTDLESYRHDVLEVGGWTHALQPTPRSVSVPTTTVTSILPLWRKVPRSLNSSSRARLALEHHRGA